MTQVGTTVPPQPDVSTANPSIAPAELPPTPTESVGPTETLIILAPTDDIVRPFEFHAANEELAELKRRIEANRWPERELVDDGTQGVQLALMQKLAHYWTNDYDW